MTAVSAGCNTAAHGCAPLLDARTSVSRAGRHERGALADRHRAISVRCTSCSASSARSAEAVVRACAVTAGADCVEQRFDG